LGRQSRFPRRAPREKQPRIARRSIEERYRSQGDYLARVEQAADALVKAGYLLVDDEPRILQRAAIKGDISR